MKISIPALTPIIHSRSSFAHQIFFKHWKDILIACLLAVSISLVAYKVPQLVDSIITMPQSHNAWFESDTPRVFDQLINRTSSGHYRNKIHPLFSLIDFPPIFFLNQLLFYSVF